MLGVLSVLVSGCSFADLPTWGWPMGVTPQATRMREFWQGATIAAWHIGVVVWGLMFWAFIVYHKRENGPLYQADQGEPALGAGVHRRPFLMVFVLFYFTVTTENVALEKQPNPDVTVDVVAFDGTRDFGYPASLPGGGGEVHTVGTSNEIPILVLPVNKVIQYDLRSKDVIHSFWTIDFLFKRDVFPYPEQNQTDNEFEHHRADRCLRRPVRRALRHLPRLDEL